MREPSASAMYDKALLSSSVHSIIKHKKSDQLYLAMDMGGRFMLDMKSLLRMILLNLASVLRARNLERDYNIVLRARNLERDYNIDVHKTKIGTFISEHTMKKIKKRITNCTTNHVFPLKLLFPTTRTKGGGGAPHPSSGKERYAVSRRV